MACDSLQSNRDYGDRADEIRVQPYSVCAGNESAELW